MKRITALLLICILGVISQASGQAIEGDPARQAAWETFKEEQGQSWTVRWDEQTALPRTIRNGQTKAYNGDPEAAARAFLTDYRKLFAMKGNLDDLRYEKTTENRSGNNFLFRI